MGFSYSSKLGDGTGIGDDGFSYNPVTDTLDVEEVVDRRERTHGDHRPGQRAVESASLLPAG